jgi:hypothetical protein
MNKRAKEIRERNVSSAKKKHSRDVWQNKPFAKFLAKAKAMRAAQLVPSQ